MIIGLELAPRVGRISKFPGANCSNYASNSNIYTNQLTKCPYARSN